MLRHLLIVLSYSLLYLYLSWNVSGGDIGLVLLFMASALIHFVTIALLWAREKPFLRQFMGFIIGVITSITVFELICRFKRYLL